jgi:asparagine synthase (glutamine-hydrolysing)
MCGIAGGWALGGKAPTRTEIEGMLDAMVHRGPDDAGWEEFGDGAIGMRRLSIIDIAGGHQPICNEDGAVCVVLNGEIYNYLDLRREIQESCRHELRTRSDTEVLVHLYEDSGPEMVSRLAGMFAFAIVDRTRRRLFLARDRFGEKPLFYTLAGGVLWFASELGALLRAPDVSRRADVPSLLRYLEEGLVPGPRTAFQGITELSPGHSLIVEDGRVRIAEWPPQAVAEPLPSRLEEAAEQLRETLLAAVRRQMIADVPVGAFLSGGIDSSSVVAAMRRVSNAPVKTFTARFEHAPYDESPIAREVAAHLGTDHHEIFVPNRGFDSEDLFRIVRHVGQPFADSSAIPTHFVSREIRRHVKVCLSGDGGDEMFGGYPLFQWILKCDRLATVIPRPLLRAGASAIRAISTAGGVRAHWLRRAWRAADAAAHPPAERARAVSRLFMDSELKQLLRAGLPGDDVSTRSATARRPAGATTRLRELMQARTEGSLRHDMLVKVDRMSMAASLEVRAPMLDVSVAAFAARLPDDLLIRDGVGKYILREAARPWLPAVVFDHPKTGFSIPLHMFQNAAYESTCGDLLLSGRVPLVREMFDGDAVAGIVKRGLQQKTDTGARSVYRSSHQLWALLNLAAWADEFKVSS